MSSHRHPFKHIIKFKYVLFTLSNMSEPKLKILAVVGSMHGSSVTRTVVQYVADLFDKESCSVDLLDLGKEQLALFNPDTARGHPSYALLRERVDQADVVVIGTPDYHGSISS